MTPEQIAAAVKPLMWEGPENGWQEAARYTVRRRHGKEIAEFGATLICEADTRAEAKAAAQAHHVAAVLSMLDMEKLGGWRPIETAPDLERVWVCGWKPRRSGVAGYWWRHEDACLTGKAINRPSATHWCHHNTPPYPPAPTQEGE